MRAFTQDELHVSSGEWPLREGCLGVDESARVHLVGAVPLLHPEEQLVEEMLQGWRNQQLSRNLQFATIKQRVRYVRRFIVCRASGHVRSDRGTSHFLHRSTFLFCHRAKRLCLVIGNPQAHRHSRWYRAGASIG